VLIDHERVLALLKREVSAKPHHGQRDLLATIARLEGECVMDEPLMERHLRLLVAATRDTLNPPDHRRPRVDDGDGTDDPRRETAGHTVRQEIHVRHSSTEASSGLAAVG
jgi:hypothetical protein